MMQQQDEPDDYVICTGETHTVREFLSIAFNSVGIQEWEDLVVVDPEFYRPAEVHKLCGDPSLAEKELGWERKTDFKSLVKKMYSSDFKKCSN